ncbi:MAG TPA: carboxypeptidase regulatory-like domain-containing protein [Terriglobia bacterium]
MLIFTACGRKQAGGGGEAATERPATPATQSVDPDTVGAITGKVRFEGQRPKPATIHMDQDPFCAAKQGQPVFAEDGAVNPDGSLPNVFIYVQSGADQYTFPTPSGPVTLDQDGCIYRPHVLGLMVGQTLRIVSSDATTHNIHALTRANREWNESQLPGAAPIDRVFAHAEVMIPIQCNEHPWMKAYVGVVKTPFFAVTGDDGAYTLRGLPPGEYTVGAWTSRFGAQHEVVTVTPHSSATLDFSFKPGGVS